jgi:tRNA A-37 threonylcarbamoyl transferase component Bud32
MPSPEVFSDRYELVRHIARGGMAQVYLAQDLLLDRPVAIKVLFPELSSDPSFVERFRREAQAAANLSHANIVSIYDWGQGEHTYFIVMEYIDGQTLSALIRQGQLAPARAAAIGADMAGALDFAHRRGVIHRDVKPGNVLIDRTGQVKVADFGIARAVSQASEGLTQTGAVMGTATYFSPEQAQGLPVDARSDVYSLGVVLYEMVTGKPPFSGDSPVAIAYKHVREYPSLPSAVNASVPADFEAIVMAAMAKDAEDRYQSAADLREDLLRFQRGEAVYAPMPGMVAPPTRVVPSRTGQIPADFSDTQVLGRTSVIEAVPTYETGPARSHAGLWAALFAFLVAVLGVLVFFIGNNAHWWGNHTVANIPSLKGQQVAGAEAQLKADGLHWQVAHQPSLQVPLGQVSGTTPGAGSTVPPDHTVTLDVSTGPPYTAVPDVTKMPCAHAVQREVPTSQRVAEIGHGGSEDCHLDLAGPGHPAPRTDHSDRALFGRAEPDRRPGSVGHVASRSCLQAGGGSSNPRSEHPEGVVERGKARLRPLHPASGRSARTLGQVGGAVCLGRTEDGRDPL